MMCPHCDHDIADDSIDSLEGICPMCEGPLSKCSSMWDNPEEFDREYTDDDFEDELFDDDFDDEGIEENLIDIGEDDIDNLDDF